MNTAATMTMIVSVGALAAAAPPCLAAGRQSLNAAFSNTIVSTYPDGRRAELWLSRDGTYKAEGRRQDMSNGHWTLKGSQICLRQSHPLTLPLSYCTAIPSGSVGSSWSAKAVTGEALRVKLVAGRRS